MLIRSKKCAAELRCVILQRDHFKFVGILQCILLFLKKQIATCVKTQEQFSDQKKKKYQSRFMIYLFLKNLHRISS